LEDDIDGKQLVENFKNTFENQIFTVEQKFVLDYESYRLIATVKEIEVFDPAALITESTAAEDSEEVATPSTPIELPTCGKYIKATQIYFQPTKDLKIENAPIRYVYHSYNLFFYRKKRMVKMNKINFQDLDIGGLDNQLNQMFRRAFASRMLSPELAKKLKAKHVKGILLYGPPGCGKTLIARKIGEMLEAKTINVVNGPEIFSEWVGKAEERIRQLFQPAEDDFKANGDNADLHVIIFDEMDAIAKQRGTTSSSGVYDSVVNQLLTKIDGVQQINNVLLIGMTNRLDLLDDAIIRSGRFEVKIEIGLPDYKGRLQIFQIHTKNLKQAGVLSADVNLEHLAEVTKNYTGADIEALVRSAQSFAIMEHLDRPKKKMEKETDIKVTSTHFEAALLEVKPALGVALDRLAPLLQESMIDYGARFQHILKTCRSFVKQVKVSKSIHLMSVLLHGPPESGKTTIAAHLAHESNFPFATLITAADFIGKQDMDKSNRLAKVFMDAHKSPLSVIVLDSIEQILEFAPARYCHPVYQTIQVFLKQQPPNSRKLLVIGTTSMYREMEALGITNAFGVKIEVDSLSREEVQAVLTKKNVFAPNSQELAKITSSAPEKIGIKKLLRSIDMARVKKEDEATDDSGKIAEITYQDLSEALEDNEIF
jgi:vesicle-fusing ATPase